MNKFMLKLISQGFTVIMKLNQGSFDRVSLIISKGKRHEAYSVCLGFLTDPMFVKDFFDRIEKDMALKTKKEMDITKIKNTFKNIDDAVSYHFPDWQLPDVDWTDEDVLKVTKEESLKLLKLPKKAIDYIQKDSNKQTSNVFSSDTLYLPESVIICLETCKRLAKEEQYDFTWKIKNYSQDSNKKILGLSLQYLYNPGIVVTNDLYIGPFNQSISMVDEIKDCYQVMKSRHEYMLSKRGIK